MAQLNINMTPEFERDLLKLMRVKHLASKAETIRAAIKECLEHSMCAKKNQDFSEWIGLATQSPINKKHKFKSDDDLWK